MDLHLDPDTLLRSAIFAVVLAVMLLWEQFLPRRQSSQSVPLRWTSNLGIGALNILLLRFAFPLLGIGLAVVVETRGWGLFNVAHLPAPAAFLLSLLLLDLLIWYQHLVFHRVPILWRLHRMHHADQDFDATTAVRFHPIEAVLSMLIKSAAIVALGVSPAAFLVFEVVLSSTSLFNHGNVGMRPGFDRMLRYLVVTPDMHRVHHSIDGTEMNRNFGFCFPWWDHLFGTYQAQPRSGHEGMGIGTREFRAVEDLRLDQMLLQPFRRA